MMKLFTRSVIPCALLALAGAALWPAASLGSSPLAARGDANDDGVITLADAVYVSQYVYGKGPAPVPTTESGDANCDARVNPLDAVAIVNYVMRAGKRPGCPAE